MTPQEKAKELVLHFYETVKNKYPSTSAMPLAKQCALIAVDEILENFGTLTEGKEHYAAYSTIQFYQQIKQELLKP